MLRKGKKRIASEGKAERRTAQGHQVDRDHCDHYQPRCGRFKCGRSRITRQRRHSTRSGRREGRRRRKRARRNEPARIIAVGGHPFRHAAGEADWTAKASFFLSPLLCASRFLSFPVVVVCPGVFSLRAVYQMGGGGQPSFLAKSPFLSPLYDQAYWCFSPHAAVCRWVSRQASGPEGE